MQEVIFREYDIRGKVGKELVIDDVYDLACSIAYYFKLKQPTIKKIAIGMDGRTHSPVIKEQMVRGFIASGLDVIFIGVCPSPVLYFALHTMNLDAGVMITASHNPKEYNGFKICLGKESVWGAHVKEIAQLFKQRKKVSGLPAGAYKEQFIVSDYVAYLAAQFKHLQSMPLSVIVDCANGAAGTVLPQLCSVMNWPNVRLLYPEVDGTYPHHEADPTVEENMQDAKTIVQNSDISFAVGLDGDCDRMAAMTKKGYLIPGDKLLTIFVQSMIDSHTNMNVVCDIKSSSSIITLLEQWGARVNMAPSGHAIIKEHMKKNNAVIGGELSCHFIFNDRYFSYDDGIYAMMRLFELVQNCGKTLDQLIEIFPQTFSTREFRIECDQSKKSEVLDKVNSYFLTKKNARFLRIDGVRVTLDYGWAIVRPSNTQPVMCIRFESDSKQGLLQLRDDFIAAIKGTLDTSAIEKII